MISRSRRRGVVCCSDEIRVWPLFSSVKSLMRKLEKIKRGREKSLPRTHSTDLHARQRSSVRSKARTAKMTEISIDA